MELIDQHTKKIMEGCKERACLAGLVFQDETLEYIVTNRDLLELSPKMMIPTLYDYWVHDVEVLKERGRYELYPGNPYETVINTRPAISFYNDNNPDWLNVMIFYHVLAHIDFFQNNLFFRYTWDYDFSGQALSDKRLIAKLRSEHGRWVDYVIEFARGIDNLVGYYEQLSRLYDAEDPSLTPKIDFYFDVFLQQYLHVTTNTYLDKIERYNKCRHVYGQQCDDVYLSEILKEHPEFDALFEKSQSKQKKRRLDLLQFIMANSHLMKKEANLWMKSALEVVRKTALFFQPQIRSKIMNEGWASYWHEILFLNDDRIKKHEVDFARVNAGVTAMPRVGLNPYALGMRIFSYIEDMAEKGRLGFEYQQTSDIIKRKTYNRKTGLGKKFVFDVRENYNDFLFINSFVDQDFINSNNLFVAGRKLDKERMVWQYYVKSRKVGDYRRMLLDGLYHPPHITVDLDQGEDGAIYLVHHFEGKPLVAEFIPNTLLGVEYIWGAPAQLETSEVLATSPKAVSGTSDSEEEPGEKQVQWQRVVYTMKNRKISKKIIE